MTKPIRILLVDDHPLLRHGIRLLLEQEGDLEVVGEAGTGVEAIRKAEQVAADVVLMDLSMPELGGLEATREITAKRRDIRVLILTSHPAEERLLPVLDAGGRGYVRKMQAHQELVEAIRAVAREEVYLDSRGNKVLLEGLREARDPGPAGELSESERMVLALTAGGYSSREIGKRLFLSSKTVDSYRSRIARKLNLGHRSEMVRFALNTGLLTTELQGSHTA